MNKEQMVQSLVPLVVRQNRVSKEAAQSALDSLDVQNIRALYLKVVPNSISDKELTIASIIELLQCSSVEAERLKQVLSTSTAEQLLRTASQIERAKHQQ